MIVASLAFKISLFARQLYLLELFTLGKLREA